MGICYSGSGGGRRCSTTASTTKLILKDGRLEVFSDLVKVSHVLQLYDPSYECFICNSDEMEFDDVVGSVDGDEVLQLGQLYFALPLSWLRRRLEAQEMATLAVKASSALMNSGGCDGPGNLVHPLNFPCDWEVKSRGGVSRDIGGSGGRRRMRATTKKKFVAVLTAIPSTE